MYLSKQMETIIIKPINEICAVLSFLKEVCHQPGQLHYFPQQQSMSGNLQTELG